MDKIQKIGHYHRALFWVLNVLVLVQGQAVTHGKNKLPHGQYTSDPKYIYIHIFFFTDCGPAIKWLVGGLITSALTPPIEGGVKVFLGGVWQIDHSDRIESNIFRKLLTSNIISVLLGEAPDPPTPYPLSLNEGGEITFLTLKCDMFFFGNTLGRVDRKCRKSLK